MHKGAVRQSLAVVALPAAGCSFSGSWLKPPKLKSPGGGAPGGKQDECHVAPELKTQQRRSPRSSSQGSHLSTFSNLTFHSFA